MRIRRIKKINKIDYPIILVTFDNGNEKYLNFRQILTKLKIDNKIKDKVLLPNNFNKVELKNNTLSWKSILQSIPSKSGGKLKVPFEIGADVLYSINEPTFEDFDKLGSFVKKARLHKGFTQFDLAKRTGLSRDIISKIENNKYHLEHIRQIFRKGLKKDIEVYIKD